MQDVNIEESKITLDKIIINTKTVNTQNQFTTIKCYQSLPNITNFEVRFINVIKIHKTIYLNLPSLEHIDLRDNKLIKISKNFKLFKNLKTLKLDNNLITFIPSFIGEFSKLEYLSISNNNLTAIPASIQYLSSLKTFKFSNNQITKLPIEFGQLKSLECLYLDSNYYTDIPTTLCYLRHLNEISFEWFEFLDPPYYKTLKESVGKTCIGIIRNILQDMIKKSELYCDFNTFVEKVSSNKHNNSGNSLENNENNNKEFSPNLNSINKSVIGKMPLKNSIQSNTNNNINNNNSDNSQANNLVNQINSKFQKIFTAIENNYYGVVKALLNSSIEYLSIKNVEHKTPFYLAIHNKNDDMINLFLEKIQSSNFPLTYVFFHKSIRMRNPELVKKLINMGININSVDDQGNGCFHVLFSAFTKQLSKCTLIADFLLEKGATVNSFNNDNWAPIHIASRRSCKECLLWILSANQKLKKEGKEQFDLNLKGKNKWTPLHLTINSYKLEETLILLENGCNIFARENNAKTPKRVSNGNYLFTKLLTNYENIIYKKMYIGDNEGDKNLCVKCFTIVDEGEEEIDNNDDNSGAGDINIINNNVNINEKTHLLNKNNNKNIHKSNTNQQFKDVQFNNLNNANNPNNEENNDYDKDLDENICIVNNSNENNNILNKSKTYKYMEQSLNNPSASNKIKIISKNNYNSIDNTNISNNNIISNLKNFTTNSIKDKFKKNTSAKNINNSSTLQDKNKQNDSLLSDITKEIPYQMLYNIENLKDNLLNADSSLYDKFDLLMRLKLGKQNLYLIAKIIIENADIENNSNLIVLSDICSYIVNNSLIGLIPILEKLKNSLEIKKNKSYPLQIVNNTIKILEIFKKNNYHEKEFFKKKISNNFNSNTPNKNYKSNSNNLDENNDMFLLQQNKNENDEEEEEDEDFNFDEMNELLNENNNDDYSNNKINELNNNKGDENLSFHKEISKKKFVANSMEIEHPMSYMKLKKKEFPNVNNNNHDEL